ncbi:hypothetical protein AB0399_25160 [Streptomyces sp. NPDC088194]|uniref:hypothetical protein n=1 Tax=Streptomyces sp. NPDC088194 TaxID=3154931 RepID=UPI00344EB52F
MIRTTRASSMAAMPAAALLLTLTSACGAAHSGDVQPDAVEKKARTLLQQTLDALHPTVGTPGTTAYSDRWTQCATETPGQHRFRYVYGLALAVPQAKAKAVMRAANAYFTKQGYTVNYSDAPDKRTTAGLPKSEWTVGLGVQSAESIVLEVNSGCVFTRHDPKTKA